MTVKRVVLVAVLTFVSALWLPLSARAGGISGTWNGLVSYNIQTYVDLMLTGTVAGTSGGQMSLGYDSGELSITISSSTPSIGEYRIIGDQGLGPVPNPFGPNGGSGFFYGDLYPDSGFGDEFLANFSVSYPSILPDGSINTTSGFADGDVSGNTFGPLASGEVFFVSFSTVPEPSSLVLAASALLIAGVFATTKRVRSRP